MRNIQMMAVIQHQDELFKLKIDDMIQDIKESQLEYFSSVKNSFVKAGKSGLIYQ